MKNVHLLLAGESRLSLNRSYRDYAIGTEVSKPYWIYSQLNIYITSDEDIKEGDWFIFKDDNTYLFQSIGNTDDTHIKVKSNNEFGYGDWDIDYCKKIILTTDQDLIKDGVQAIDDEFLEWFVKNPSCESVEVKCYSKFNDGDFSDYKIFEEKLKHINKIIIPQEEPKQETLEEAAEKWYDSTEENKGFPKIKAFKEGAKWQQEQDKNKYSEEDLRTAYFSGIKTTGEGWNGEYANGNNPSIEEEFQEGFQEWLRQFKNK